MVIQRLSDERNDPTVWESLFARARDIAAEHDIPPCIPRQQHSANHPINNPSDYWRVSLYYVFLDHLVAEITKRLINNEEHFLASHFLPSKLASLTPEVAGRIFDTYHSDVGERQDFDDEIARWKVRWNRENNKPDRLLDLLNLTNADLYPSVYKIIWILLTMPVSSATSERSFSAMRRVKSYLRSTMGDERLSNLSLLHIHRHMNVDIDATIVDFVGRKSRRLDFE